MTVGRKFAYAEDLAILHYGSDWQALEGNLLIGHGNSILLSLQMEAQAQYNNSVGSLPFLQQ